MERMTDFSAGIDVSGLSARMLGSLRHDRPHRAGPRPAPVDREPSGLAALRDAVKEEVRPQGALESLLVARLAGAAWRLQSAVADPSVVDRAGERAERSLLRSLRSLMTLRTLRASRAEASPPTGTAPVFSADVPGVRWGERLAWDLAISDHSPIIRGTWITVSQIVTRIIDGWSWSDVLRAHPELTEDDIRACLAYTVEEGNDEMSVPERRGLACDED